MTFGLKNASATYEKAIQKCLKSQIRKNVETYINDVVVKTVNTKNWYKKMTDLWAEFGNEMPFDRKNLLRGFGKDSHGQQYAIIRQKDCLRF
jgi:hypothetical protein